MSTPSMSVTLVDRMWGVLMVDAIIASLNCPPLWSSIDTRSADPTPENNHNLTIIECES